MLPKSISASTGFFEYLTQHAALLDSSGTIIYTNTRWREFAAENGGGDALGSNYLSVSPPDVRLGLQSVMAGEVEHWRKEYPCHSPSQRRFFLMQVSRAQIDGQFYVLVTHEDISAQRLMHTDMLAQYAFATTHALQEPLRQLTVTSSALASGELSPARVGRYAEMNLQAAQRLSRLLDSLGQYASLASEHMRAPARFDLNAAFRTAVRGLGVTLVIDGAPLPPVLLDSQQGSLLARNLLHNLAHYQADEKVIHVEHQAQGPLLHLYMRLAHLEQEQIQEALQLFQRQGHPALGLSQQVAYQSGGKVWMETQGERVGLHLTLPLWNADTGPLVSLGSTS